MKKIFYLILLLFVACSDQVESHYPDFESALNDKLFERGWIADRLVCRSMKNIFLRNNLDRNTCIFSFSVAEKDKLRIMKHATAMKKNDYNSLGIDIPGRWQNEVDHLPTYQLIDKDNSIFYIAIDNKTNRILGWRDENR